MSEIYKIETYSEVCAQLIAGCIHRAGGRAIVRGWAIITDHEFTHQQTCYIISMVSKTSGDISDDDIKVWMSIVQLVA